MGALQHKQTTMPTFNSNLLITDLQQQTESFLNEAVQQWQMLPPATMLHKESPEKWSATQCLMHLNSYGLYYLPAIAKTIDEAKSKQVLHTKDFKSSWIGNYFTELMLPKDAAGTVRKMKAPKNHTPLANDNSDVAIATFIDQQEMLLQLLEKARGIDLRKATTPVSISKFIRLPVGDTFRFLIAHNYRHVLQAKRAIAHAKLQASGYKLQV
ncbi:DinB family protein [Ilyomonas limi]|uniref:DinB family protein n=2 Tax=Ilyomonas limi TaxID=2575867 RepID=A0A4U3L4B0_9BACT|nr:DinB family protein [Ilyomonas limi]